jgi:hypothetical protein
LTDEHSLAWTAMPYRAPVLDTSRNVIGSAESLLGDEDEDIFHGVVVKTKRGGHLLEIPAARVQRITTEHVYTSIRPHEIASLEPYREDKWFHLGWGGHFRKHPMWKKD